MKFNSLATAATLVIATFSAGAHEAIEVQNAWARMAVKGQMGTGAFMTLTAKDATTLVGASSPLAGVTQVHEMKMDGVVMKMAELKGGLPLPAGKAVELKPGGYHIMLMDLRAPVPKDSTVPLTLIFRDAKGAESRVELRLPVATTPPVDVGAGMRHAMPMTAPASK